MKEARTKFKLNNKKMDKMTQESTVKILIVDDTEDGSAIQHYLQFASFNTDWVRNCQEMENYLRKYQVDLIILDVHLPDGNGLSLVEKLRAYHQKPIILISAVFVEEIDRVVGLELGADDYLIKPLSFLELKARINAIFRRYQKQVDIQIQAEIQETFHFGDYVFNVSQYRLHYQNNEISLTNTEYKLLTAFVTHANQTLNREWLTNYCKISLEDHKTARAIDVNISRLRRKIQLSDKIPPCIRSVRKQGYRFIPTP
ncbi:response regulator transcription factor [Candidatus Venteria ishoeyi]|uniref:response regulator transcription factor n=1 Tax=Candidatus Venteria ishoeyi TaxID=1899563 RepID=UPI0025A55C21|nr:response regulator transcription factor [Candidatus Venteria ishoeyi]MDM8545149.1 response regulator transcription factor [Candidatus Venteria ishoeyi]